MFCGKLFECSGMDVKPYVYLINLQSSANLTSKSQGMDRTGFLTSWSLNNKEHLCYLAKNS